MKRLAVFTLAALIAAASFAAAQPGTGWDGLAVRYKQVLVRYPSDAHTRYNLAMVYAHEGQLLDGWRELQTLGTQLSGGQQEFAGQVTAEANRILQRSPADVLTRYRLAFALYFAGQKDAARLQFERIVALEPNHSWSLGYLGYAYMDRGDLNRAIALWERGVKVDPANSVLHYALGLAYTRKGELKNAARHFAAAYRDRTLYEYVKGKK